MKILPRFRFVTEEMLSTQKMKIVKFKLAYHIFIHFWIMILKDREFNDDNSAGQEEKFILIISF